MTLTLTLDLGARLDLDILKMYLRSQNEVSRSRLKKLSTNKTDTQTDRQTDTTERITTPHSPLASTTL